VTDSPAPLTTTELESRLDYLLSPVLSARRTAAPLAGPLALLSRQQQGFVLHWIEVIDRSNYEMAYQFAAAAPAVLVRLDAAETEAWIIQAMDTYDREGLHRGCQIFRQAGDYTPGASVAQTATFEEYAHILELFVCGLAGRRLKLEAAAEPCTDTETLYLPARIALFPDKQQNFRIFKILATLLWAQNRYGTFRADLAAVCATYADPARAATLLAHLESIRLEARIAGVLPGVARDMAQLRGGAVDPSCRLLTDPGASVDDSIALLPRLYGVAETPQLPYRIALHPSAFTARNARLQRGRGELDAALTQMLKNQRPAQSPAPHNRIRIEMRDAVRPNDMPGFELQIDGQPVAPPEDVAQLIESILQDLGEIPDDWLHVAGDGSYRKNITDQGNDNADMPEALPRGDGTHVYNEWDHRRRHYRKNWCVLRERDGSLADAGYVDSVLAQYRPQVAALKRTFELLRGEEKLLRRQPVGDDIDFDALIPGYAELKRGQELPDRLLTRRHKTGRDIAVLFMVDMSGSTKGWVNEAEREALVMLCEALEVLGDRYAIYGFSGVTRKRCEVFRIKRFDEPYDNSVKQRIAGITPQDYTRMGVAIRHLTKLLNGVDARTKLLITLSDGKPDDYSDNYRGEYGIEDTRQALIEAHHAGVNAFCITIDHEARDYLPHLYGPVNWTLVDNVEKLPLKVADIYRRLTI